MNEEMKWKLCELHLQNLLKVINNCFYSFPKCQIVLKLFDYLI